VYQLLEPIQKIALRQIFPLYLMLGKIYSSNNL
jgi:hypothetical protein